jgi:ATP-dependent DNA ligase
VLALDSWVEDRAVLGRLRAVRDRGSERQRTHIGVDSLAKLWRRFLGRPKLVEWVKLKLVREVAFTEWTEDEQLRQTFLATKPPLGRGP